MPRVRAAAGFSMRKWRALLRRSPTVAARDRLMRSCAGTIQLRQDMERSMLHSLVNKFGKKVTPQIHDINQRMDSLHGKILKQQSSEIFWNRLTGAVGITTIGFALLSWLSPH